MIKRKYIFIFPFLISYLLLKQCGIHSIIDKKIKINKTNSEIFEKKNILKPKNNLKSFTIFGWIKLKDKNKKKHPMFSFQFLNKKNNLLNKKVFSVIYDNISNNDKYFKLENFLNNDFEKKKIISIINEKWFFFVFSIDFEIKKIKVFFEGKEFIFENEYLLDLEKRLTKQNFFFYMGCDFQNKKNCSKIVIKNINYTLEKIDNINNLYLLVDSKKKKIDSYFFDIYNNKFSNKLKNKNILLEGEPSFIDDNGLIYYSGKNILKLEAPKNIIFNGVKTQSGFIVFKFTRDIPNNFKLLTFYNNKNEIVFEIILKKNFIERKRSLILNIPKLNKRIYTKPFLRPKKLEKISFSIIEKYKNFQVWLNHQKEVVSSEFIEGTILKNGIYILFEKLKDNIKGGVIVYQINFLNTSKGFFYNLNKGNSKCFKDCDFLLDFDNQAKCGDCKKKFVLDYEKLNCVDICPLNFKNEYNRCFECEKNNCSELEHDFFKITKIDDNTFEILQKNEIDNFDGDLNKIFNFDVSNAKIDKDFKVYKKKDDKKKIIFVFEPINNHKFGNSHVKFSLKENLNLNDGFKNQIYMKNKKFKLKNKFKKEDETQYQNKNVKKAFGILGRIAAIIFFISMFIGLIGLFYKCKNITNTGFFDFYYQKFLQTFLMSQYIAFWTFYNTRLPSNLENYFHYFFSYTINWHNLFKNSIYHSFDESSNFVENWYKNIFEEFHREHIHYNFVISFGFVLLLQLFIMFLSLVVYLIYDSKKKLIKSKIYNDFSEEIKITKENSFSIWTIIKNHFFYKFIFSIFMMFIIETIVFCLYNFSAKKNCFEHSFFIFSFIVAIVWLLILCILFVYTAIYPFKNKKLLLESNFYNKYGFIYKGLELTNYKKQFQTFQYLHYIIFSIVLVCAYNKKLVQIILNSVIYLLFFLLVVIQKPANTKFWKKEQIIIHSILLIAKCFIFSLVVDDKINLMNPKQRWIIGFLIMIFTFFCIIWNFFILIYKLCEYKKLCEKSNYQKPEINIDRDYEGPNTLYQIDGGTYHKIQRPDLQVENRVINNSDSTPSFYKTVFSDRKKKFLEEIESRPVLNSLMIEDILDDKKSQFLKKNESQVIKDEIAEKMVLREIDKDLKLEEIKEIPFNQQEIMGLNNTEEIISILDKVES